MLNVTKSHVTKSIKNHDVNNTFCKAIQYVYEAEMHHFYALQILHATGLE